MKKQRTNDFMILLFRVIADPIVAFFMKTNVTPNQISFLNFILFIPAVNILLFFGGFRNNIIAIILLLINALFDLVDGGLARKKNMKSKLGEWMEQNLDPFSQMTILFSIALHILVNYSQGWKYLALLPLFGQSLANMLGSLLKFEFGIDYVNGNEKLYKLFRSKKTIMDNFLKNMVITSDHKYLLIFTFKYYMSVGILFNLLPYTFIIFGFFITFRALCLYVIFFFLYSENKLENKYATFKYLRSMIAK